MVSPDLDPEAVPAWEASRWPERMFLPVLLLPAAFPCVSNQAQGIRNLHKTCSAERSKKLLKDLLGMYGKKSRVYKEPAGL